MGAGEEGHVKRHPEVGAVTALLGKVADGKALQPARRVWTAQSEGLARSSASAHRRTTFQPLVQKRVSNSQRFLILSVMSGR